MSNANQVAYGLEGVIALETELSLVEGATANLYYPGYHIDDLVEHATYEAVVYLLFTETAKRGAIDARFQESLSSAQACPSRSSISSARCRKMLYRWLCSGRRSPLHPITIRKPRTTPTNATCARPFVSRAKCRPRRSDRPASGIGKEPILPRRASVSPPTLFTCSMAKRAPMSPSRPSITALILHAEHGLNASTFPSSHRVDALRHVLRITAASAVERALHGGANEAVMKMLIEIGTPDRAEDYVRRSSPGKSESWGSAIECTKTAIPGSNT